MLASTTSIKLWSVLCRFAHQKSSSCLKGTSQEILYLVNFLNGQLHTFFVLDLGLDILDSVARFDLQCNSLASQSLHKDLHTTSETQNQVQGRFFLDVVVAQRAAIFELLASEDESLLIWRDTCT